MNACSLLPRDSVPTRQSFELLVRLRTAVLAHDGLHSFCQHFPAGVKISGESLRVHGDLGQAMQQGMERHDRIPKCRANIAQRGRVGEIPCRRDVGNVVAR